MRVTTFREEGERVDTQVSASPPWQPFDEYDGKPLEHVRLVVVERLPLGEIQLVAIAAGGYFAMHASPDVAFCQVVRGRGKAGPAGRDRDQL
jgi:quercetin dioxygenase-like cupin family protein